MTTDIKDILTLHMKWLNNQPDGVCANLQGIDLQDAYLQGIDLQDANLRGVDLQDANLRGVDLRDVDLQDANLRGANLEGANLQYANLEGANLEGANLRGVDLQYANLRDVTLNWQSHALLSEILIREAEDHVGRRMLAGLIAISTDWCWKDFLAIDHPEKEWALKELAKWVQPNDGAPKILQ
jgi:uncharacterized protein YjbI with pentapeptide repeats